MNALLRLELRQPQTLKVIFAQSVDLCVGLLLTLAHGGLAILTLRARATDLPTFSMSLLLGVVVLAWSLNLLQRLVFVTLLGATLGQYLVGVRACLAPREPRFWLGQAIESLHLVLPFLWLIEIAGRLTSSPLRGLRYMVVSDEKSAPVRKPRPT